MSDKVDTSTKAIEARAKLIERSPLVFDRDTAAMLLALATERDAARAALDPFARIWRMNEQLSPDLTRPLAHFIAGSWPVMADAKRAAEVLGDWRLPRSAKR